MAKVQKNNTTVTCLKLFDTVPNKPREEEKGKAAEFLAAGQSDKWNIDLDDQALEKIKVQYI